MLIEQIITEQHLTHLTAFHAQQCVEKCFKAVIEEKELGLLKIHNLQKLGKTIKQHIQLEIDIEIVRTLDKLYIDSRYPGDLGLLPDGKPSLQDAQQFYEFARDIFNQLKQALEQTDNQTSGGSQPSSTDH